MGTITMQKELDTTNGEPDMDNDDFSTGLDIFSLSGINKLTEDEILDRIEDIDAQSCLLRWRLWAVMRDKYPSDREFGQRIADLKATRSICAGGPAAINREMHAGRWCKQHKINNLADIGILKSVIYILSSPANKDISDKLFKQIKKKSLSIKEVNRLIDQERAVLTIEKQEPEQTPAQIDYDKPSGEKRLILVEKGIAQIPDVLVPEMPLPEMSLPDMIEQLGNEIESAIEHHEPVKPVTVHAMPLHVETVITHIEAVDYQEDDYDDKTAILADMTDDEIMKEIMDFVERNKARYKRSPIKMIPIFQACIEAVRSVMYPKK